MQGERLRALADRLESEDDVDSGLVADVVGAIKSAFPAQTVLLDRDPALLTSADAALHVVDAAIPAWGITIKGMATEPDGHWSCTLRETGSPDEIMLGIGRAASLPCALVAALLRVAAMRVAA